MDAQRTVYSQIEDHGRFRWLAGDTPSEVYMRDGEVAHNDAGAVIHFSDEYPVLRED